MLIALRQFRVFTSHKNSKLERIKDIKTENLDMLKWKTKSKISVLLYEIEKTMLLRFSVGF